MKTQVNIWFCDTCGKETEPVKYVQQADNVLEVCVDCFNTIKLLEKLGMRPPNKVSCDGCHKIFEFDVENDHQRIIEKTNTETIYGRFIIVFYCEECYHKETSLPYDQQTYIYATARISKMTYMRSKIPTT